MASSSYWDRFWQQRRSRRRLLAGGGTAAVGLAGLALVGCGDDDDETPTPTATATGTRTPTGTATASPTQPAATPVAGGTFRFFGGPIGGNLDIHRTNTPFESSGLWHWAGNFLVRFNVETYLPEADLAQALPEITDGGLTYTFKLNPAAKFQNKPPTNGRQVTAEDVKLSFERIKALGVLSPRSGNYVNVDSITAIDATTVQFKLKSPQADLLNAMSDQYDLVVPKEITARGEEAIKVPADVVGSGAFELVNYEAGRGYSLKKRADGYWKPNTVFLDGAEYTHQPDPQQAANAIRAGQADSFSPPSADLARTFLNDPKFQVLQAPNPTRECLLLNHTKPPFDRLEVRQAIWRAVNRELVYRNIFGGGGIVGGPMSPAAANWVLPESELKKLPGFRDRATEIKEAKDLLSAAGYPDGFEETLMTATAFQANLLADQLIPALAEVGIRATPENVGTDFNVMLRRQIEGSYTMAATLFLSGPYPDAQVFIYHKTRATGGSRNYSLYSNPDMDAKLDRQRTILDFEERKKLVNEIQVELIKNPGPVWIGSRISYTVVTAAVQNARATPFLQGYNTAERVWLKRA
jgi:peptide/nickel transport system substrate-binding protein